MIIESIYIKNFRSIKELEIFPSRLCALIGPNSVGKTNIMKAIDLVIGEGWTTKAKVARELFNNPSCPIQISISFQYPIEYRDRRDNYVSIRKIILEMGMYPGLHATTKINDGQTFYSHDEFKRMYHFIHIPSERQLTRELQVSQWTMLGKLMRVIYENYVTKFNNNEDLLKGEFAEKIKPAKDFLEADFSDAITFRKFVDTFTRYCIQNSAGLAHEIKPVLNIYNLNWFYKTLQIHVNEGLINKFLDSEEVGSGMQNLLMISIFQTYSELMGGKVIFGIEEPEIYLYPHAQRALYNNFIDLSKNTQIFYSTHSPNLVDAERFDDIILLRKNHRLGTYALEKDSSLDKIDFKEQRHKIYTQFNKDRNEIFFSNKVLLVEGASDKILYSTLCERHWNIDLDEKGISIIECSGKGGVNYFIGVCSLIGFTDYFAVWDSDSEISRRYYLDKALGEGKGLEIDPNLEAFLNLPNGNDANKVKNAFEWADNCFVEIPNEFLKIESFLCNNIIAFDEDNCDENNDVDEIPF
ncbi:MAG TPA: AAA family ATPase [Brevefilum sp.]|nr:AAA family ATPase [Brevefilum sp.]